MTFLRALLSRSAAVLLLFIATIAVAQVWPEPEHFARRLVPIFESRIFRVPDATQDRALQFINRHRLSHRDSARFRALVTNPAPEPTPTSVAH